MPLPPPPSPDDLPVAGIDPIDNEADALAVVAASAGRPLRSEIIAILLDRRWHGHHVLSVGGVTEPDAVLDVAELLAQLARSVPDEAFRRVILASVRPTGRWDPGSANPESANFEAALDDPGRWMEASSVLAETGVELVEWFVIDHTISCPRDLLCDPPRWPSRCGSGARSA